MYLQNFDWREILQFLNILNKHITNHGRRNYTFWSQPLKNLHLTMSISCYFCCISISNTVSELWQVVCVCMCAYVCVCVCVCVCVHAHVLTLHPGQFHFSTAHHQVFSWTLTYIRLPGNHRAWNLMHLHSLNSSFRFTSQEFILFFE